MSTYNISLEQFTEALKNPYAWPGGYPRYFVTSDCASLCHPCAVKEKDRIVDAIKENSTDGWRVIAVDVNWEDPELYCDHCGKRIESAYAEDQANKPIEKPKENQ